MHHRKYYRKVALLEGYFNIFLLAGEDCKGKWKNLKDYFHGVRKQIKKAQQSGSGAKVIAKLEFYERLQFLLDHVVEARYLSPYELSSAI